MSQRRPPSWRSSLVCLRFRDVRHLELNAGRLRQRTWETPEGDKRSVTELEADEVGASLKFATAKVERAPSRGSDDRGQERGDLARAGLDRSPQPQERDYAP